MQTLQLTEDQRTLLAEIGRLHLVRQSHLEAARFCRDQIEQLRTQLQQLELSQLQQQREQA